MRSLELLPTAGNRARQLTAFAGALSGQAGEHYCMGTDQFPRGSAASLAVVEVCGQGLACSRRSMMNEYLLNE